MEGVLRLLLATGGLILGPIILAILLGLLQHGVYALLAARGWIAREAIPPFIILMMRGLFLVLGLIAVVVFYLRFVEKRPGFAPPGTERR